MNGNQSGKAITGYLLLAGLVLFILLLHCLNVRLGIGNTFSFGTVLRGTFLFICLTFLAGTAFGLTQLRKR